MLYYWYLLRLWRYKGHCPQKHTELLHFRSMWSYLGKFNEGLIEIYDVKEDRSYHLRRLWQLLMLTTIMRPDWPPPSGTGILIVAMQLILSIVTLLSKLFEEPRKQPVLAHSCDSAWHDMILRKVVFIFNFPFLHDLLIAIFIGIIWNALYQYGSCYKWIWCFKLWTISKEWCIITSFPKNLHLRPN